MTGPMRTALLAVAAFAFAGLAGPAARAQESGGTPSTSPSDDAPTSSATGNEAAGSSRGGRVGGDPGAGGTGAGNNTSLGDGSPARGR